MERVGAAVERHRQRGRARQLVARQLVAPPNVHDAGGGLEDPNAFSFVEEWESWDTLTAHFRTDHVGRFLAGLGDVLAAPPEGGFHEVEASRGVNAIAEAREAASA